MHTFMLMKHNSADLQLYISQLEYIPRLEKSSQLFVAYNITDKINKSNSQHREESVDLLEQRSKIIIIYL